MPIGKDTRGFYDTKTGKIINIGGGDEQRTPTLSSSETLASFANKYPVGSHGGECGRFANTYLQAIGGKGIFTDPIADKKAHINSSTPTV